MPGPGHTLGPLSTSRLMRPSLCWLAAGEAATSCCLVMQPVSLQAKTICRHTSSCWVGREDAWSDCARRLARLSSIAGYCMDMRASHSLLQKQCICSATGGCSTPQAAADAGMAQAARTWLHMSGGRWPTHSRMNSFQGFPLLRNQSQRRLCSSMYAWPAAVTFQYLPELGVGRLSLSLMAPASDSLEGIHAPPPWWWAARRSPAWVKEQVGESTAQYWRWWGDHWHPEVERGRPRRHQTKGTHRCPEADLTGTMEASSRVWRGVRGLQAAAEQAPLQAARPTWEQPVALLFHILAPQQQQPLLICRGISLGGQAPKHKHQLVPASELPAAVLVSQRRNPGCPSSSTWCRLSRPLPDGEAELGWRQKPSGGPAGTAMQLVYQLFWSLPVGKRGARGAGATEEGCRDADACNRATQGPQAPACIPVPGKGLQEVLILLALSGEDRLQGSRAHHCVAPQQLVRGAQPGCSRQGAIQVLSGHADVHILPAILVHLPQTSQGVA